MSENDKNYWEISCLTSEEKSALKRCAGKMMGNDMRAEQAFYHAIGYKRVKNEEVYFAALCMACLWDHKENPETELFEVMLHDMYHDKNATDSTRHKLTAFLDLSWGKDGFLLGKLCSLARRMRADSAGKKMPNFEKLARDLEFWNDPNRRVQRRWIKEICLKDQILEKMEEKKNVD